MIIFCFPCFWVDKFNEIKISFATCTVDLVGQYGGQATLTNEVNYAWIREEGSFGQSWQFPFMRCVKAGFYPPQSQMFEEYCAMHSITAYSKHSWAIQSTPSSILPPIIMRLLDTRNRSHPYQLPSSGDRLHDNNFVVRILLYKHKYIYVLINNYIFNLLCRTIFEWLI